MAVLTLMTDNNTNRFQINIQFNSRLFVYRFSRSNRCKAALQEIKFLQQIYILQKLNIFNLWQNVVNCVYSLRGWHHLFSGVWLSRII